MKKIFSTENHVFHSLVGPSEKKKLQLTYKWLQIGTLSPKFDKFYFFVNTPHHFSMICKKILKFLSLFKVWNLNS